MLLWKKNCSRSCFAFISYQVCTLLLVAYQRKYYIFVNYKINIKLDFSLFSQIIYYFLKYYASKITVASFLDILTLFEVNFAYVAISFTVDLKIHDIYVHI